MSLRWYRRPRMVVLSPSASAQEAARAIENNNIGAVLVQDKGSVVGILTDRDIATRIVGQGRSSTTRVGDVMSAPVATLSPADHQIDAIRLMRDRNIRRIALVEHERLAGMVTLDDLLLDEAAPLDELAAVIEAQIGQGGPTTPATSAVQRRRVARAETTYGRLLTRVREETGLQSAEQAEAALEVVLSSVVRRLTPDEAKDLLAQLPSLLQRKLTRLPPGPDKVITRETIQSELAARLDVEPERAAQLLSAVAATIAASVSTGEMEDVQGQLPPELGSLFSAGASASAPG